MSRATDLSRMSRRLVENARRYHSFPLLLLPSTPAAFSVVSQCIDAGLPAKVVGNALWMKEWAPALVEHVHSPLSLWRVVKDSPTLPFTVACFQDQLANVDSSFHSVIIEEQRIRISPIEVMLAMRFRPHTFIATAMEGRPGKPSLLSLAAHVSQLPDHMSVAAFDAVLGEFLHPTLECQRRRIGDWHARELFALKVENNFERMLSQRMQEIESLIRIYQDRQGIPATLAPSLERLRLSRRELARHSR